MASAKIDGRGHKVTTTVEGSSATAAPPAEPKKLLVALSTGPTTDPSKAALAFLVASRAAAAGHSVSVFLAGRRRAVMPDRRRHRQPRGRRHRQAVGDVPGVSLPAWTFYVSGMSCKARGITPGSPGDEERRRQWPVTFEMPPELLELTFAADSTLSF